MISLPLLVGPVGVILVALGLVLVFRSLGLSTSSGKRGPLPPGPPGELILGHLRVIPAFNPEFAYMRWSKQYGSDILSFNVLGQPVVILNSVRAAVDLLDQRGANYSDRPRFVLFEVMGWKKTLTFLRWGPDFRMHRRILQKGFQKSSIVQYRPLQQREALIMLRGFLERPADWENVLRRFATAVVMGIGFGISINSADDPFIKIATDVSHALGHAGAPAGTPVDFFPYLRYLPRWFHDRSLKFATDWKWSITKLYEAPYNAILESDERTRSLLRDMMDQRQSQIEKGETPELSLDDIKGAAGAVYAAGQDTTWSTIIVFVLNMILRPEVQTKAQRLLDEVVGRDRLPNFDDRSKLQYIDYIVQETLRWCPVSPVGVPHRTIEDDVYKGYYIPAGSFVYANARAMTHDVAVYSDPDEFYPDRYASVEQGGRGEPYPAGNFGFGRRVCVGKHLAEASVWIVAALMLSTMKIEKGRDEEGNEITPQVGLTYGLTSHPQRYPCRITPRDERGVDVISRTEI